MATTPPRTPVKEIPTASSLTMLDIPANLASPPAHSALEPPENESLEQKCQRLEAELAKERARREQAEVSVKAYEAELSALYEERATGTSTNDDQLISEMHSNMTELYNEMRVLSDTSRQKSAQLDDVMARYEELKAISVRFKSNETKLITALTATRKELAAAHARLRALKEQAQEKLDKASTQIDRLKSVSEREVAVLRAKVLKYEASLLSHESLMRQHEERLRQKQQENEKLAAICDELIERLESADHQERALVARSQVARARSAGNDQSLSASGRKDARPSAAD